MKIVIFGAGGLGLYFAARLAQQGHEITLKGRDTTVAASMVSPLNLTIGDRTTAISNIRIVSSLEPTEADAGIITTKAWQVQDAAKALRAVLPKHTPVLTTQNGIDAPSSASLHLPPESVFASTVVVIAKRTSPCAVRVVGSDASLTVGSPNGNSPSDIAGLCDALTNAGISTEWTDDIASALWKKLALICSYGGVGAALDATVGQTREDPRTRDLVLSAMSEVFATAATENVTLSETDFTDNVRVFLDGFSPETTSSMHRDLREGRRSELEEQVGAVVHRARRAGVKTPVLDFVYSILSPAQTNAWNK